MTEPTPDPSIVIDFTHRYVVIRQTDQPLYLKTSGSDDTLVWSAGKEGAVEWQLLQNGAAQDVRGTLRTIVDGRWIQHGVPQSRLSGAFPQDTVASEPRYFFAATGEGDVSIQYSVGGGAFRPFLGVQSGTGTPVVRFELIDEADTATGFPDAIPTAPQQNSEGQCQVLFATTWQGEFEPDVTVSDGPDCETAFGRRELAVGAYPNLAGLSWTNTSGTVDDSISSMMVPENFEVDMYREVNFGGGAPTTFTSGSYPSTEIVANNQFSSAVVRRKLPWELFQTSMCFGLASGTAGLNQTFDGRSAACDGAMRKFCEETLYQGSVCGCYLDILLLDDLKQSVGVDANGQPIEIELPVACFGPNCAVNIGRGYLPSENPNTCEQTICTQNFSVGGESFIAKGNELNLTCGGEPIDFGAAPTPTMTTPGTPTPSTAPTPAPTPAPDSGGLSTAAIIGIAAGALVLIGIVIAWLSARARRAREQATQRRRDFEREIENEERELAREEREYQRQVEAQQREDEREFARIQREEDRQAQRDWERAQQRRQQQQAQQQRALQQRRSAANAKRARLPPSKQPARATVPSLQGTQGVQGTQRQGTTRRETTQRTEGEPVRTVRRRAAQPSSAPTTKEMQTQRRVQSQSVNQPSKSTTRVRRVARRRAPASSSSSPSSPSSGDGGGGGGSVPRRRRVVRRVARRTQQQATR